MPPIQEGYELVRVPEVEEFLMQEGQEGIMYDEAFVQINGLLLVKETREN